MQGAEEEENDRYRKFLSYCEEKREELKARIEEDEERLKEAKRKHLSIKREGRSVEDKED